MKLAGLALWAAAVAVTYGAQSAELPSETPTYARDVAPVLFEHCTDCHRPGQMAPMSFLTYESTRPWARAILKAVTSRAMPPWFADPSIGHFLNDPTLSDAEVATLARWVEAGAPPGDTSPPAPPVYNDGWQIGTPDLVVSMPKPFNLPATGIVEYQYIEIPTNLTEDRWVQAMEIRPGDRRVVHHLRVFARAPGKDPRKPPAPGQAVCLDDEVCGDLEPPLMGWGPNIASIAVGTRPEVYPPGTAKLLKAGSVLTLHVHYTTIGEPVSDLTRIGLVFAKAPPKAELKTISMAQPAFVIPPGASDHPVEANVEFKADATLWSLGPHNHLRGKSWRFELIEPDGRRRPLLSVPRFDFNWQLHYFFEEPIAVKAGSRLHAVSVFDNSTGNPNNPDPTASVGWGELTTDEMMFASIVYSVGPPPQSAR
jgi:mono/diheme cytochrome c family protein